MGVAERHEEEVEDDEEDEDGEEVVVFRGCGLRRHAGRGSFAGCGVLRCCCRKEDGGHPPGLLVGAGWLEGPGRYLVARWGGLVGAGAWGTSGAAISTFCVRLSSAPAIWEGMRVRVRGGKQFAWAAFGCRGPSVWGCGAVCGGRVSVTRRSWVCLSGWGSLRGVCVGCGVLGVPRLAWQGVCGGRLWAFWREGRALVAGPGAVRFGGRVWATWWGMEREWQGVPGSVCVPCVRVCVRLPRCAQVVACRFGAFGGGACRHSRPRREFCKCLCVFGAPLGRWWEAGTSEWAKAHAPGGPVNDVGAAGDGALWL